MKQNALLFLFPLRIPWAVPSMELGITKSVINRLDSLKSEMVHGSYVGSSSILHLLGLQRLNSRTCIFWTPLLSGFWLGFSNGRRPAGERSQGI